MRRRWRLWLVLAAALDAALWGWIGGPAIVPAPTGVATPTPRPVDPLLRRWWYTPETALQDTGRLDALAGAIDDDVRAEGGPAREWRARRQILAWTTHPNPAHARAARRLLGAYERKRRL